jgi:hypothetical protein
MMGLPAFTSPLDVMARKKVALKSRAAVVVNPHRAPEEKIAL